MDVQRSGETAPWRATPQRPLLSSSSPHAVSAAASSLGSGAADGGLLATFDAIFRQTLSPEPASLDSAIPAPTSGSGGAREQSAPHRTPSTTRSASGETDADDDDRESTEPPAAAPRQTTPESEPARPPLAEQAAGAQRPSDAPQADAAEPGDAAGADAAAAAADAEKLTEPERSGESSLQRDAGAAESAGDAADDSARSPHVGEAEEEAVVDASESAVPLASATPIASANGEAVPETAVAETPEALDVAGKAADSGDVPRGERAPAASEPSLPLAAGSGGEPNSATAAASEASSAEGEARPGEPQPVAEEASRENAADGGTDHRRDSGEPDENRPHERNENGSRNPGGQRNAGESASRERAIDSLVAQMQPLESPAEAPPLPSAGAPSQPLAGAAAAVAAAPGATSAAAVQADGGEPAPTSGDRLSLDGGESRRSVGSVKGESGDGRVQGSSNADRVRLVQRVARAFQRLGPDGGRVQVMLHPAELGSVRLDLRIEGQRMEARMTAESEAARSVLREHLPELRQRLVESGLTVERIEIEVDARREGEGGREGDGRRGSEAAFGNGERQGQGGGEHLAWRRGRHTEPTPPSRPAPAVPAAFGARTGLDLMA